MSIEARPLFAISISPAAREWLQETQQVYILHVFDRVINIVNQESNVLSLVAKDIGNGPFALVLPIKSFPENITMDVGIKVFGDGLWLDDLLILIAGAKEWGPSPDWSQVCQHEGRIIWATEQLTQLLRVHAKPESMARLILDPLAALPLPARMLQVAEQSIPLIYEAIKIRDTKKLSQAARQLAGMGPGLTPAGDDLLMGFIYGLWTSKPREEAKIMGETIAKTAIPRTHALSAAWLAAAARGEAAEPWHQMLAAIAGENRVLFEQAVTSILSTGHTSGADALGGFLGVLRNGS